MSAQENLWKATTCYFGEQVEDGRVIAIATYVDRRRICFLINGKEMGQWVPEEALYQSASSLNSMKKEAVSSLEVEKEAQQEAKDNVNTLVKIVEQHKQIVAAKSVDIDKISRVLQTIIMGLELGAKLVVSAVFYPDKVVIGLLETISFIVGVKDHILKTINQVWSRYWRERVLTTLIKGERIQESTSKKIVDQLKIDYPGETNRQLAERIVLEKAVYTSITGFLQGFIKQYSGKLPEGVSDFIAGTKGFEALHQLLNNHLVNFFDSSSLLEEMIYQVALIYGVKSIDKGDILVILAAALTPKVADLLEMNFLIDLASDVTPLVPAIKNMLAFMVVGYIAIDCYEVQKETGKMRIGSLEALLSLENRASAYLTEISSKDIELEQALASAISVESAAVPELLSARS